MMPLPTDKYAEEHGIYPGWCDSCHRKGTGFLSPKLVLRDKPYGAVSFTCTACYCDTIRGRKTINRAVTRQRRRSLVGSAW